MLARADVDHQLLRVRSTQAVKKQPEKNSGLNEIRAHDLAIPL